MTQLLPPNYGIVDGDAYYITPVVVGEVPKVNYFCSVLFAPAFGSSFAPIELWNGCRVACCVLPAGGSRGMLILKARIGVFLRLASDPCVCKCCLG